MGQKKKLSLPWLVWLSGLNMGLWTKGSLVPFPVGAGAWVAGQVPSGGCSRGNHTLMFLSLSPSLPLYKNKSIKSFFLKLSSWLILLFWIYIIKIKYNITFENEYLGEGKNVSLAADYLNCIDHIFSFVHLTKFFTEVK